MRTSSKSRSLSRKRKRKTTFSSARKRRMTHDRFVYILFSHKSYARAFFQYFLPTEISRELDFDTLELFQARFVDRYGREKIGDIFYQARLKNGGKKFFVIFLEHKSQLDRNVSIQMTHYDADLLEFMSKDPENYVDNDGKLPAPYPILFTQVSQPSFDDIVSRLTPNARYGISFECQTIDVSQIDLEKLRDVACLFASFAILRLAKEPLDENWEEKKERLFEIFDVLASDLSTPEAQEFYQEYATGFLSYSAFFIKQTDKLNNFIDELRQHEEERFGGNKVGLTVMQRFFRREMKDVLLEMKTMKSDLRSAREQLTETQGQLTETQGQLTKAKKEKLKLLQKNIVSLLQARFPSALPAVLCRDVQTIKNQRKLENIFQLALTEPLETIESKIKLICL